MRACVHACICILCLIDADQYSTGETSAERLQWHAVQFLLNIREHCKMSHTTVEHVMDGIIHFINAYSTIILVSFQIFIILSPFYVSCKTQIVRRRDVSITIELFSYYLTMIGESLQLTICAVRLM